MENTKSMLAVAYELLSKSEKPMAFFDLFNAVAVELNMNEDEKKARIAQFYTNLSLDGDFVVLSDNTWDLRERVPFEKVHIDMNDAYLDKDEDDSDSDDESAKELGEDDDVTIAEDSYEDDESEEAAAPDDKEEEVKKELGV